MACVQPLSIKWQLSYLPSRLLGVVYRSGTEIRIDVPCGWCLNCRVDRRNWLEDAINYELKNKFNGVASFVCLTYDDLHINDLRVTSIDNPSMLPIPVFNSNGSPKFTLRKKHFVDFIKRFRSYVNYHKPFGINPDFKIVYCTEYGGRYQRPHAHFLLLGCDSRLTYKILKQTWTNGIIDCGSLDNGGIRYVLDYVEKQVKGPQVKTIYLDNDLEPPCLHYSKGLGKNLILDNLPFILSHDLNYPCGAFGKMRPIPNYYKRLLLTHSKDTNKKLVENINYFALQTNRNKPKSLKEYNKLSHELSLLREQKLVEHVRRSGSSYDETYLYKPLTHPSFIDLALQAYKLSGIYKNFNCDPNCLLGDKIPF